MSFFNFFKIITFPLVRLLFPTKVYGKENYTKINSIVCCNHFDAMDVAILANRFLWGECNCVAKEELFRNKLIGAILRKSGAISVNRDESDLVAYRKILAVLKEGKQLIIFPEGTRNTTGTRDIQPIMPGTATFALKAACPIIPMVLHHKPKAFKRNYMLVGKPITMEAFASLDSKEAREKGTDFLYAEMCRLKHELDAIVEDKKKR